VLVNRLRRAVQVSGVIPRALRHLDVAARTRDRVVNILVAVPDLHRQRKRFAFIAITV